MTRPRDNQRERVYAWQHAAARVTGPGHRDATMPSLDECAAFLAPVWRAERGRFGLGRAPVPEIVRPSWGQRSALAHDDGRISLPRWARSRWVVLHEAAHHLTPNDEAHGPRFVGVLIGLLARHDGRDAQMLMRVADSMGVRYHVRSVGVVPVVSLAARVARYLPGTVLEIAIEMNVTESADVTWRQVAGAALTLVSTGAARFRGKVLVPVHAAAPPTDRVAA